MKNSKADQTQLLAELRRLECKPPKRADRLVARHLKCEESQSLAHKVRPPLPAPHLKHLSSDVYSEP